MEIWQILGIAATSDEATITQAYRQQLRHCHPEEDPQGFQRLRQAYEQALTQCRKQAPLDSGTDLDATHTHAGDSEASTAEEVDEIFRSLTAILTDAQGRFDNQRWQAWSEAVHKLSLSKQAQLSSRVLALMSRWLWLPGCIIERLWQTLEWEHLGRGDREQQENADYLNWWRNCDPAVPINWLASLSNARQRAIQCHWQPLKNALDSGQLANVAELALAACPAPIEHPALALLQLRAITALAQEVPASMLLELCEQALTDPVIKDEDLPILAKVSRGCGKETLVLKLAEMLMQRGLDRELCEHLRLWLIPLQPGLAQQLTALARLKNWIPTVAYCFDDVWPVDGHNSDVMDCLLRALMYQDHKLPKSLLPLQSLPGIDGACARLLWACKMGSWQQLQQLSQLPPSDLSGPYWPLLGQLLQRCAADILAKRPQHRIFDRLAQEYGNEDWMQAPPPDAQEMAQPSREQWLDAYNRHPLLPNSWFNALYQRANMESWGDDLTDGTTLANVLAWQRGDDFNLDTALADATNAFVWYEFYYAMPWVPYEQWPAMRAAMPELPQGAIDTPLWHMWQISLHLPSASELLTSATKRWPEQFPFSIVLKTHVGYLYASPTTDEELWEQTLEGDLSSLAALTQRSIDQQENLEHSILLWAALRYHPNANFPWNYLSTPQLSELKQWAQELGVNYQDYEYDKPSLIHGLLNDDLETDAHTENLAQIVADKECQDYIHPCGYCLALIANDFSHRGFNTRILERLQKAQPTLPEDQQRLSRLLLGLVETKINQLISRDRIEAPERFRLLGSGQLVLLTLLVILQGYLLFPLSEVTSWSWQQPMTLLTQWQQHWPGILVFISLNLLLCYRLCHTRHSSVNAKRYGIWCLLALLPPLLGNSFWWGLPLWLGHLLAAINTRAGALRNGWPRRFKNKDYLSLQEIVD